MNLTLLKTQLDLLRLQSKYLISKPAMLNDADRWITVHPNGKDSTGQPALIGEDGTVKGGMGGKFNGQNIKDTGGTKKFTKYEANNGNEMNAEMLELDAKITDAKNRMKVSNPMDTIMPANVEHRKLLKDKDALERKIKQSTPKMTSEEKAALKTANQPAIGYVLAGANGKPLKFWSGQAVRDHAASIGLSDGDYEMKKSPGGSGLFIKPSFETDNGKKSALSKAVSKAVSKAPSAKKISEKDYGTNAKVVKDNFNDLALHLSKDKVEMWMPTQNLKRVLDSDASISLKEQAQAMYEKTVEKAEINKSNALLAAKKKAEIYEKQVAESKAAHEKYKLDGRHGAISVYNAEKGFKLSFPYDKETVAAVRNIAGSSYNPDSRNWIVPASKGGELRKLLDEHKESYKEPVYKQSKQRKIKYHEADMPTEREDGSWYDAETGEDIETPEVFTAMKHRLGG